MLSYEEIFFLFTKHLNKMTSMMHYMEKTL